MRTWVVIGLALGALAGLAVWLAPTAAAIWDFDTRAAARLAEAAALRERAERFDQAAALAALRAGAPGYVFRLDQELERARTWAPGPAWEPSAQEDVLLAINFNGRDRVALLPAQRPRSDKQLVERRGLLHLRDWYRGNPLKTRGRVRIDPADLGVLEIRARVEQPTELRIAWDTRQGPSKTWQTSAALIPDGTFHVYRMDLSLLSPVKGGRGDQTITGLTLLPRSETPTLDMAVDYVRIHHIRAAFSGEAFGTRPLSAGGETRRGLFANTPLSMRYELALPDGPLAFTAGLAAYRGGDAVDFAVTVEGAGGEVALIEQSAAPGEGWRAVRADLSPWAGQTVQLTLSATSGGEAVAFWGSPEVYQPREDPTRVVVILEDTERGDHISALGYRRPTTPTKDALFQRGAIFSRAFSQAPKTRPSCASFMTSLPTRATGVSSSTQRLAGGYLTLPEILQARGFATAVFTQNVNSGASAGLSQGVDALRDSARLGADPAAAYSEDTLSWVERHRDRDLFLYLHLIDPHGVYDPPEPWRRWYLESGDRTPVEPGKLDPEWETAPTAEGRIALYDGEIAHNDDLFSGFIEALGRHIPLEDTLLVFLSDHGEHQGEHGLWGHTPPSFVSGVRVPLMIRYDRALPPAGVIDTPVQLMDLSPTILELVGVDPAPLPLAGRSLVPLLRAEAGRELTDGLVISEEDPLAGGEALSSSIFFRGWHLLYSDSLPGLEPGAPAEGRLFDFLTDPGEQRPLSPALTRWLLSSRVEPLLRGLAAEHDAVRLALSGAAGGGEAIELDESTLHELRELGYVE